VSLPGRIPAYLVYERTHHSPLALGMVTAAAVAHDGGALAECIDFEAPFHPSAASLARAMRTRGPGIVLFSHYVWNSAYHLHVAKAIKAQCPECVTVHGGPHVPATDDACREFMRQHPEVDIAVRAEGEAAMCDLLSSIASSGLARWNDGLAQVPGLTYRADPSEWVRTTDRARQQDLATFPSPYLTGLFERHTSPSWMAAIVETNRGCPYGCTFCDWGSSTLQKIRIFDLERVKDEIDWIAKRRVEIIWIADANFGILDRDILIGEHIARARERYRFPRQVVVNYAKNATARVTEIVRILSRAGLAAEGILSLQTTDQTTLRNVKRSNIKTDRYVALLDSFRAERLPVSTDLLLGLPGATRDTFRVDLQFCFDHGVSVKVYHVQILPNSQMADPEYQRVHGLVTDARNYVLRTGTASESDLAWMRKLFSAYQLFVEVGLLKYVLYFLQAEYGVRAVKVIEAVLGGLSKHRTLLARLGHVVRILHRSQRVETGALRYSSRVLFTDWRALYSDFGHFLEDTIGIPRDSRLQAVLDTQVALMPSAGRRSPRTFPLEHDVAAYFKDLAIGRTASSLGTSAGRSLKTYPPGHLTVSDPHRLCWFPHELLLLYDTHRVHFELQSELLWDESVPRFFFRPDRWSVQGAFTMAARVLIEMVRHRRIRSARAMHE
jgi:radical SAM superfamily enzyme YgiQ (UPF0313 family)